MALLAGFHVEGWDHLVVHAYIVKMLGLTEDDIKADWVDHPGRGWRFILDMMPKALKRFYEQCAQFAVLGIDNDGNENLVVSGANEDERRPRHWNHPDEEVENCRWCELQRKVRETRPRLTWLPQKPGTTWPILIMVPVEMIEAWLLTSQAIVNPGSGSLRAEDELRHLQKEQFYGVPEPTREHVESTALPLVRSMNDEHLQRLSEYSRSFKQFADQVVASREQILGSTDCWGEGDQGAESEI